MRLNLSKTKNFAQTTDNPFDQGKNVVGLGNKRKKNKYQKIREKLQERIDNEPDLAIKEEIRKGNIVETVDY